MQVLKKRQGLKKGSKWDQDIEVGTVSPLSCISTGSPPLEDHLHRLHLSCFDIAVPAGRVIKHDVQCHGGGETNKGMKHDDQNKK